MAALEAQLGVSLFRREGSRKPELTDAGRALLPDARAVADEADGLVARARGIRQGLETEVALAVDVMMPTRAVAGVLRDFQHVFPTVDLRLHIEALGGVAALVLEQRADLGIAGPDILDLPELERMAVGSVELVPVAAPGHPLAQLDPIGTGDTRQHLQLVLTDRSPLTAGREFSVLSPRTWRLADLGAKHALLIEGIGWGNMPRHAVEDDLAAGRLVLLSVPEGRPLQYGLHALWRKDRKLGPATSWVLDAFAERC